MIYHQGYNSLKLNLSINSKYDNSGNRLMTFVVCFYNQTLCLRPIPSLSEYFFLFFSSLNNFFADFARIAKNGHKNYLWMILQLRLFVHSITKTMGIEILIFGNQTGLGMQRKPNFGPKIECTDDGISTKWVKFLNKIILLS